MQGFPVLSRRVTWALVVLAGATRLAVALADHRSLIANDVYPDDAFYYLRIAANTVAGRGLTFDGLAPTNGFQPLYFILLLPIVALSHGSLVFPIHASGVLLAVWAAGTAAVLRALLSRLAGPGVALFGLLLWAVCPYFILMSVNGLETGPAMFFTLLVPLLYLSWFRGDEPAGAKRALAFGAVCGLAVLARLDLLLLIAAVGADALLCRLRASRGLARPALALTLVGAAGVCLPWALISHAQTGHWIPLSGAASREIALQLGWIPLQPIWAHVGPENLVFDPRHVPPAFTLDVVTKLAVVFLFEQPLLAPLRANVAGGPWAALEQYVPYLLFLKHRVLFSVLAICVATAVVMIARRRARARAAVRDDRRASLRRLLVVFLLLVTVGYGLYAPAHWYFNRYLAGPILLATAYLLAEAAPFVLRAGRHRGVVAVVAVAIVACQLAQGRFFGRLRWSETPPGGFLGAWNALGSRVDAQARIGAFQAGIYGWFSGRDIVNLDGKVNQDAAAALHGKRLHEYVRRQGIRYVIEWPRMLDALCARHAPRGAVSFRSIAKDPGSGIQLFEVIPGD